MKKALTVAGSDSGGGAGIQQDLKVFSSLSVYGTSVITAITAQNTLGIQKIQVLPLQIISAQIDSVMKDISPDAVKTGMLVNSEIITLVYEKVKEYKVENLVVDPVMVSTSGDRLLDENSVDEMKKLVSIARLTTPNIYEAEILSGIRISTEKDMEKSAKKIGNCIVTGGHLNAVDVLYYDGEFHHFESKEKIKTKIHGTGCAFSAAITASLAKGLDIVSAIKNAKGFMDKSISRNFSIGSGLRILDTADLKLGRTFVDREKNIVIGNIENAVQEFIANENSHRLMPEVGINIAMALKNAKNIEEVAGITGRLVRDKNKIVPVGNIDFGGSYHIARIILTIMKFDPEKRAAMNIKFSDKILKACEKLDLSIGIFDREKQPKDKKTMEWGTLEAIKECGRVPDIIYDKGAVGKEAMIRILGKDAKNVVGIALRIGELL